MKIRTSIKSLNEELKKCNNCRLSETRINVICGEGNLNSRIILIAQAPGKVEDEKGKMFLGPTGKILNELLNKSNINRNEIYMTNLIKCMLPKYRKPKQDEIKSCSYYLDKEIELINPKFLIPLGYYATRYIFEKFNLPLPIRKNIDEFYNKIFLAGSRNIFPLQHPTAGLHDNSIKKELIKNYRKLKIFLKDCKWYPVCPMKRFYEQGKLDKKWIELYCKGDWEICIRYQMEENGEPHSDFMLPDGKLIDNNKVY